MCKCKVMRILRYCIYYDSAGKNVGLEGRRLVLTPLTSSDIFADNSEISIGCSDNWEFEVANKE